MRCRTITVWIFTCAVLGTGVVAADDERQSDDVSRTPQQSEADQAEMMKKWQHVATPGKPHEVLRPLAGKWKTVTKMSTGGPEGSATETEGAAEYKWILGGRYLQETFEGTLYGMPFNGMGLYGYDNFKKKYTGCWVDSASTAMQTSEGLVDRTGKVLTLYGTMDEWMTGEHDKVVKFVFRIIDNDQHVFEIHDLGIVSGDKEDTKVIEITYTRDE